MARIVWTIAAVTDLEDIGTYIAKSSKRSAYDISVDLYDAQRGWWRFLKAVRDLPDIARKSVSY